MIQSPYAITLTPAGSVTAIVLVAVGGWLDGLPSFDASQDLFETEGVNLTDGYFRPLGNVVVSVEFTVESDHDDLLSALEAFLDADMAGDESLIQIGGTVRFVPGDGSAVTTFGDAVVSIVTPDLPSGETATTTRAISIKTSLPI